MASVVYVWGENTQTQLGLGDFKRHVVPETSSVLARIGPIADIVCAEKFAVAITTDGSAYIWGAVPKATSDFLYWTLGQDNITEVPLKIEVRQNYEWTSAAVCHRSIGLVSKDGKVVMLGDSTMGQLGIGRRAAPNYPTDVQDISKIVKLAVGYFHCLALDSSGDVYSWGAGSGGKLGTGETSDALSPVRIEGLSHVKDIAAGKSISAALTVDGEVYTWGSDKTGALGQKGVVEALTPKQVELPEKIVSFSLYESHMAAISETGKLFVWGRGTEGQLGWGTIDNTTVPVLPTVKLTDDVFTHVACAMYHTVAATKSNKVYAWGQGTSGQLGVSAQWKMEMVPRSLEIQPKDIIFLRAGGKFNMLGTTAIAEEVRGEVRDSDSEWEVEKILGKQFVEGKVQYLVKWKDYPPEQNSWEGKENLLGCRDMIKEYEKELEIAQNENRKKIRQEVKEASQVKITRYAPEQSLDSSDSGSSDQSESSDEESNSGSNSDASGVGESPQSQSNNNKIEKASDVKKKEAEKKKEKTPEKSSDSINNTNVNNNNSPKPVQKENASSQKSSKGEKSSPRSGNKTNVSNKGSANKVKETKPVEVKKKLEDLISKQKLKALPRVPKERKRPSHDSYASSSYESSSESDELGSMPKKPTKVTQKPSQPEYSSNHRRPANEVELEDSAESGPVESQENETWLPKATSTKKTDAVLEETMIIDLNEEPEPILEPKKEVKPSVKPKKNIIADEAESGSNDEDDVSGETKEPKTTPARKSSTSNTTKKNKNKNKSTSPKNKNEKRSKSDGKETTLKKKGRERLKTKTEVEVANAKDDSEEEEGSAEEFEVEKIISHKLVKSNGEAGLHRRIQYVLQIYKKYFSIDMQTQWEPLAHLGNCQPLIDAYERELAEKEEEENSENAELIKRKKLAKYVGHAPPKWIGKAREEKGKKHYQSIEIDGIQYNVEDDVYLIVREEDEKQYRSYGRIKSMWEDRKSKQLAIIKWYFLWRDMNQKQKEKKKPMLDDKVEWELRKRREVFVTNKEEHILLNRVGGKICVVNYQLYLKHLKQDLDLPTEDIFFTNEEYDEDLGFAPLSEENRRLYSTFQKPTEISETRAKEWWKVHTRPAAREPPKKRQKKDKTKN